MAVRLPSTFLWKAGISAAGHYRKHLGFWATSISDIVTPAKIVKSTYNICEQIAIS